MKPLNIRNDSLNQDNVIAFPLNNNNGLPANASDELISELYAARGTVLAALHRYNTLILEAEGQRNV